jgi:hypothetical protein
MRPFEKQDEDEGMMDAQQKNCILLFILYPILHSLIPRRARKNSALTTRHFSSARGPGTFNSV